jgi:hypothetical protein
MHTYPEPEANDKDEALVNREDVVAGREEAAGMRESVSDSRELAVRQRGFPARARWPAPSLISTCCSKPMRNWSLPPWTPTN